jgi:hypothetical protein
VGSTHDSLAFACSNLGKRLQQGDLLGGFWIAADAAYECMPGVISPWAKSQLLDEEEGIWRDSFNYFHSSLRMHVEQAFGILVARFGILWRPLKFSLFRVGPILSACMRLHNYCIDSGVQPVRASMSADEQAVSDAAFRRWWAVASAVRDDNGEGQGRRSDLCESDMRQHLSSVLSEKNIIRPR